MENSQTIPVDDTPSVEIPNRLHSHGSNLRVAGRKLPLQVYARGLRPCLPIGHISGLRRFQYVVVLPTWGSRVPNAQLQKQEDFPLDRDFGDSIHCNFRADTHIKGCC
jgi:hypothetical protein